MSTELEAFVAALPPSVRRGFERRAGLSGVVDRWVSEVREAWPAFAFDASEFMRYVAPRVEPDTDDETLAELHIVDMGLVFACLRGEEAALTQLERSYFQRLEPVVARVAPGAADLVLAQLRERLLVPGREGGGLAGYAGKSSLWTWLRVSAVRSAVRAKQRGQRQVPMHDEELERLGVVEALGPGPDVAYEKQRFVSEVRAAVEAAFAQLPARDKTLLMQHYVDGLTTERLGRMHGVHRVSISRRLVRARRSLLVSARTRLIDRLALSSSECDNVMRLVQSQLHITLERVLA